MKNPENKINQINTTECKLIRMFINIERKKLENISVENRNYAGWKNEFTRMKNNRIQYVFKIIKTHGSPFQETYHFYFGSPNNVYT